MRERKRKRNGNLLAALLLLLSLGIAFFFTSKQIFEIAENVSFRTLRISARQFAREVRRGVEENNRLLEAAANMITGYERVDSDETGRLLASFEKDSTFFRMELLLPDNRILREDGGYEDATGVLSFEELARRGAHISGRETEPDNMLRPVVRSYVPIVRGGETQAVLCGMIDLEGLTETFDGQARGEVCLLEGASGNFLIDTLHEGLGNTEGLSSQRARTGFSAEEVIDDMAAGRAGQAAFYSETAGEDRFCAYEPVGINDWMAVLSLPESTVFRDTLAIRTALGWSAALEAALFLLYFTWRLVLAKREAREKNDQLDRIQYILSIEETLFDAPRNPALIEEALRKVASALGARRAFFITFPKPDESRLFECGEGTRGTARLFSAADFPTLRGRFLGSEGFVSYDLETLLHRNPEEYRRLRALGIESMMVIPVRDLEERFVGALGAINLRRGWETAELLECVMLSFSMAAGNMESFRAVEEMGRMDHLTGLHNRNSFQKAMEYWEKSGDGTLSCVYVDADGLHEINNNYGHISGDRLLQAVADALREQFGPEDTYRIGGDEFVAFCHGLNAEQVVCKVRAMERAVAEGGYHMSVGVEWRGNVPLVYEMVSHAERRMFAAKRAYYESRDDAKQAREMNRRLEEMLTEKQDLDVFRSVLASKYTGVYIVDLSVDVMRSIYIPPYFERMMAEAGGKFSAALRLYVGESVAGEYEREFRGLLEDGEVEVRIGRGEEPELRYRKKDGSWMLLRIYRSPDYTDLRKECIWTFESL